VPNRVEEHTKRLPRLELRFTGAERQHLLLTNVEINDIEVEMGLLRMTTARPSRRLERVDTLERQRGSPVVGKRDPLAAFLQVLVLYLPAGDACIEASESVGVGTVESEETQTSDSCHRHRLAVTVSIADVSTIQPLPLAGEQYVGPGAAIEVRSPYDNSLIGQVPACTPADVDRAVAMAKAAHHAGALPAWKRAEILDLAAVRLKARVEEFALAIAREAAKPIKTARVEAQRAVGTFIFSAVEARKLAGEMVPMDANAPGEGKIAFTLRLPIGVVGAIAPFNFPLNLVVHKVGPAIAAGCPVVLKPASQTPFSAILLAKMLIDECGLPPEMLHVVTGSGGTVGNALVDHPDVALITFTGSPEVGWGIRSRAPRKRVGLELGNNAPVIIEADADWQTAAAKIKVAGFSHAGQSCISTQRIYVHRSLVSSFTESLASHVSSLVVGDPLDEATDVSALISTGERDRVKSWIDEAVAGGAKIVAGGTISSEGVLAPTIIADVSPDMKVCAGEVFGPVVTIQAYDTLDEALKLANDSAYGLQAAIFTQSLAAATKAFRTLDYGGVLVNEVPTFRTDQQPYGGLRDSGNTREGPAYSVREMTEDRLVIINL
jgi:acyl-CoA reductase-like NAD-dependent aldehyde dehydrogenase